VTHRRRPPHEDPAFLRGSPVTYPPHSEAREAQFLRAQLLGEARDCRAAFFRDACTCSAEMYYLDGGVELIDWRLLDAAEAFERRAEAVR